MKKPKVRYKVNASDENCCIVYDDIRGDAVCVTYSQAASSNESVAFCKEGALARARKICRALNRKK